MQTLPLLAFFTGCFLFGLGLMVMSSQLACRKQDMGVAARQSALLSVCLTAVKAALPLMDFLRLPLMRMCNSVGLLPPYDAILADVYVLILASWPLTVWTTLATQAEACTPTPDARAAFKQELQSHLTKLNGTSPAKPVIKG
jgi:hypothetical protein